jgi:cytochrome c peroxidase
VRAVRGGALLGLALLTASIDAPAAPVAQAALAPPAPPAYVQREALAALGRALFFDASLSASGRMACATCHDPRHAYGPPNARAVQLGGAQLRLPGRRAVPSLRYLLVHTPRWAKQYQASAVERVTETDSAPVGGFTWDGRFDTLRAQSASPLLTDFEMGNASAAELSARVQCTAYADRLRELFGARVFDDPPRLLAVVLQAIERFELDDPSFRPYSSRYDAWLENKATLSAAELRGLQLFNDPHKGNCNACHSSSLGADGSHPLFTDFSYAALGVPRNPEIPANADASYADLGLCGPLRTDLAKEQRWCGMFKTPSLRNAAARGVFFHNGRVHTLRDAVRFYAERDTHPERWYPLTAPPDGVHKFDDLPAALRGNVNRREVPMQLQPGDAPLLGEADIDDLVAFIATLTDADVQP